jgi:hypothetical protein
MTTKMSKTWCSSRTGLDEMRDCQRLCDAINSLWRMFTDTHTVACLHACWDKMQQAGWLENVHYEIVGFGTRQKARVIKTAERWSQVYDRQVKQ